VRLILGRQRSPPQAPQSDPTIDTAITPPRDEDMLGIAKSLFAIIEFQTVFARDVSRDTPGILQRGEIGHLIAVRTAKLPDLSLSGTLGAG